VRVAIKAAVQSWVRLRVASMDSGDARIWRCRIPHHRQMGLNPMFIRPQQVIGRRKTIRAASCGA
jgi:hypothetical protein